MIAKMTAKDGKRDAVVEVLRDLVAATESEPGTLVYALNVSAKEPDVVGAAGDLLVTRHGGHVAVVLCLSDAHGDDDVIQLPRRHLLQ